MATDDISTTTVSLTKHPIPRKHRIHSHSQSKRKLGTDESRRNRTMTATNRTLSKLPNLLANASIYPTTSESTQFRRYRSLQRDPLTSSSSKLERQSTTVNPQTRVSTLYSSVNGDEQKRISQFRRRQIYALNHLMRDLEQEQFRQFCKSNNVSTDKQENIDKNNEDTDKELLT